jgi:membrane-associated HD superfamily phosphohydrolase
MKKHTIVHCKNCGHNFHGNFCSECGQNAHTERIDSHFFLHDIPHSVLHIDKGFFYTFKELVVRPGHSIREYLDGKRVRHFRPLAYLLLLSTISTLVQKACYYLIEKESLAQGLKIKYHLPFLYQYISLFFILMIPVMSLASWLVFRYQKYNFWEHLLLETFIVAQFNIVLVVMHIAGYLGFGSDFTPYIIFYFIYVGITYGQFYVKVKREALLIIVCIFIQVMLYLTGLSLSGIMTKWWE